MRKCIILSWWTMVHNFLYLSSIVYLFGTFQEACLKLSRRTFAFYLIGYLSLVITPSVILYASFLVRYFFFVNVWITWIHPYCRGWYTGLNMSPICFWLFYDFIFQVWDFYSKFILHYMEACWEYGPWIKISVNAQTVRTNKICSWILRWILCWIVNGT